MSAFIVGLQDLAFDLFVEVHTRLGHNVGECLTRVAFDSIPGRKRAWEEIAKVLTERQGEQMNRALDNSQEIAQIVKQELSNHSEKLLRQIGAIRHQAETTSVKMFTETSQDAQEIRTVSENTAPEPVDGLCGLCGGAHGTRTAADGAHGFEYGPVCAPDRDAPYAVLSHPEEGYHLVVDSSGAGHLRSKSIRSARRAAAALNFVAQMIGRMKR